MRDGLREVAGVIGAGFRHVDAVPVTARRKPQRRHGNLWQHRDGRAGSILMPSSSPRCRYNSGVTNNGTVAERGRDG